MKIEYHTVCNPLPDCKLRLETLSMEEAKRYVDRIWSEEGIVAVIETITCEPQDFRNVR